MPVELDNETDQLPELIVLTLEKDPDKVPAPNGNSRFLVGLGGAAIATALVISFAAARDSGEPDPSYDPYIVTQTPR